MRNEDQYTGMLELIKASLWGNSMPVVGWNEFGEMETHAIASIPAAILTSISIDSDLRNEWKKAIFRDLSFYTIYECEQKNLPISVPYIILKGLAAAKYYPNPEYRTMGDIDILTKKEDYEAACEMLMENGYREVTQENEEDFGRHRSFTRNGIIIEVHVFFALLKDSKKGKLLDKILVDNIGESHYLPDMPNGLVLLDHINQHLAGGLGLRQIIDWMMFVDKCLPDEKWPEFQEMVRMVGLETLAITTTRMCELYLGLPEREWCAKADKALCQELMDYVLSCGNFGEKRNDESSQGEGVFSYVKSIGTFFRLLHMRGMVNWPAAKRHVWLRPFAWIYQLCRYLIKGLGRDKAIFKLKKEFAAAKKKNNLLDRLEVRRYSD